jgi:hypothetical protein
MPVSLDEDAGKVLLTGACVVEEAEALNAMLQRHPDWPVDASECEYLHTAVLQVLMSQQPKWLGLPKPPHLRRAMEKIFCAQTIQTDLSAEG